MLRPLSVVLIGCAISACSSPVGDPLDEGFRADPRPVLGAWAADLPTPPGPFGALVEREAGTLSGYFEFELWGRWWVVHFRDASWDGQVLRFVEPFDFGQREADSLVYWEARYVPQRTGPGASPSRIALTASFGPDRNCCLLAMTYYRPAEFPAAGGFSSR